MQSGVSTDQVQRAICNGTRTARSYSATEREAACRRYEEMTGLPAPRANTGEGILLAGSVVVIALVFGVVIYLILKRKTMKKALPRSRAFVSLVVALIILCCVVLGSIYPISRADAYFCHNKPVRLTLIKNELGEYLTHKSEIDKLTNFRKRGTTGTTFNCNGLTEAELYTF
jgi:hypothetical protein